LGCDVDDNGEEVNPRQITVDICPNYFKLLTASYNDKIVTTLIDMQLSINGTIVLMSDNRKNYMSIPCNTDIYNKLILLASVKSDRKNLLANLFARCDTIVDFGYHEYKILNYLWDMDIVYFLAANNYDTITGKYKYESPYIIISICHLLPSLGNNKIDARTRICTILFTELITASDFENTDSQLVWHIINVRNRIGFCPVFDAHFKQLISSLPQQNIDFYNNLLCKIGGDTNKLA